MRILILCLTLFSTVTLTAPAPQSPPEYVPEPEVLPKGNNGPWSSSFFGADPVYNGQDESSPARRPQREQKPERSRDDIKNTYLNAYVRPPPTQDQVEEEKQPEPEPEPALEDPTPQIKELLPQKGSGPAGVDLGCATGGFEESKEQREKEAADAALSEMEGEPEPKPEIPAGGLQHGSRGPTDFHVYTDENGKRYSSDTLDPETETYIREKMLPKFRGERKQKSGDVWSVFGP